jgi:hypothetical protein
MESSMQSPEPLPREWLDRVFGRLMVRYADAWARMWVGLNMEAVRADWCDQLAGVQHRPEALKHALEHLPLERPPTAAQFRELCNRAPMPVRHALPEPVTINHAAVAKLRASVGLDSAVKRVETDADAERRMTYAQRQCLAAIEAHKRAQTEKPPSPAFTSSRTVWPDPGPLPWPSAAAGAKA